VCYALEILPSIRSDGFALRGFLSEERAMADIDLDLASGNERESAIQYVYQR